MRSRRWRCAALIGLVFALVLVTGAGIGTLAVYGLLPADKSGRCLFGVFLGCEFGVAGCACWCAVRE